MPYKNLFTLWHAERPKAPCSQHQTVVDLIGAESMILLDVACQEFWNDLLSGTYVFNSRLHCKVGVECMSAFASQVVLSSIYS